MTPQKESTTHKKITNHSNSHYSLNPKIKPINQDCRDSEICMIMSKILNISEETVASNIHLFENINHYMINSLYYLSNIEGKQKLISAVHSLEFVCNFNKRIDEDLKSVKS